MTTILIAEDVPANLKHIKELILSFGYQVRVAVDGEAVLKSVELELPDLILMDINMPKLNGFETCALLKQTKEASKIPVIFISVLNDNAEKSRAFDVGGVDYLTKPLNVDELEARIRTHLELSTTIRELESFNSAMIKREQRIIELKQEVNKLSLECGKTVVYPEVEEKFSILES